MVESRGWRVVAADGRERGPIGGRKIAERWKREWEAEGIACWITGPGYTERE